MKATLQRLVEWTRLKAKLALQTREPVYFKEREVWWASLGLNIGYEQDGKNRNFERPVLIIKKFNKYMLWVLPLTSQNKKGKFYYQFYYREKRYSVILSQIRTISSKRLSRKLRTFPENEYCEIKERVKRFFVESSEKNDPSFN